MCSARPLTKSALETLLSAVCGDDESDAADEGKWLDYSHSLVSVRFLSVQNTIHKFTIRAGGRKDQGWDRRSCRTSSAARMPVFFIITEVVQRVGNACGLFRVC